jgi:type IV pilus assembly protein PilV
MVGLLGLMQTVIYALNHNLNNQLRQEAVLVADGEMATEMAMPFAAITSSHTKTVARLVNGSFKNYSVSLQNKDLTSLTKQIDIEASWRHKQTRYNHTISTLVTSPAQ